MQHHDILDVLSDEDTASSSPMSSTACFSPAGTLDSWTSVEFDARSVSPAPSVYSLTNSIREQSYRVEFGRGLNNYSEVYRLPADAEELDRLDKQHYMLKEVMGNYVPPMAEVMADDDPAVTKACLDLGCGNGAWIMDVARQWPESSCVAVDLVPMQSLTIPRNCRSEVDDINLGLEHFYGDFDVVHTRLVSTGIRDYYRLIDQISRVLRPGGLADFTEVDFRTYSLDHQPITPSFGPSLGASWGLQNAREGDPWLSRWFAAAAHAARRRGGHLDAAALLHRWISQHKSFEDVVYREYWLPVSPWMKPADGEVVTPEMKKCLRIANCMSDDVQSFLKSGRPLLLGCGIPVEVVDELEENAERELQEARTPLLIRVQNVYCRKKRA